MTIKKGMVGKEGRPRPRPQLSVSCIKLDPVCVQCDLNFIHLQTWKCSRTMYLTQWNCWRASGTRASSLQVVSPCLQQWHKRLPWPWKRTGTSFLVTRVEQVGEGWPRRLGPSNPAAGNQCQQQRGALQETDHSRHPVINQELSG